MIMYCLLYALVFAIFVGVTTLNFGTLVRYKIPCMPFYVIALLLVLERHRIKKPRNTGANPKPRKTLSTPLLDPDLISARVRLFGFPNAESFNEYYPLGVFFLKGKEIKIEYPEEFTEVGSESYYRNKRVRLYSFHPTNKYDFKTLNAQIYISTKDQQTIDLATFGEFDIYMSSWYYFNEQTNSSASWVMIGPSGRSQKLSVPDLPYEINERVPNIKPDQLMYAGAIQVSDYAAINGYSEYLQFITGKGIDGPYKFGRAWKEQIFTESGHTSGRYPNRQVPMLVELLKIVE